MGLFQIGLGGYDGIGLDWIGCDEIGWYWAGLEWMCMKGRGGGGHGEGWQRVAIIPARTLGSFVGHHGDI